MPWPTDITPEEHKCVEELKKRTFMDVTNKMLEDPSLFYRFAKARNFNVKQSEAMLRKNIAWRKEYKVDTILTDFKPPEHLNIYVPINPMAFDKDGSTVQYTDVSGLDTKGMIKSTKKSDLIKYMIQVVEIDMERLHQQSEKLGRLISKAVYIYNFDKFTLSKATNKETLEFFMSWINTFQDNYPERVKSVYIINASIYFTMFFSVLKCVIASALIDKVQCFGTEGWKEVLREIIEPDHLPQFLGGNVTDPDGNILCKSFVKHGEVIPESYYFHAIKRTLHQKPGVKKLVLARFSSTDLSFDINESGSLLEWEFETKSKDIGFGVYFKDKSENLPIELVPKQRIDTCFETQTGLYKCEKIGTYILVFDNSYSWVFSKEIYYRVNVQPPNVKNGA